jgi:hypothetical protein
MTARPHVVAILKTLDIQSTIEWYLAAGFELTGRHPENGVPTWCEVHRDGLVVQFLTGDTPWPGPPTMTGTLYVHPPSVQGVYDQIKERVIPSWGPEVREWGTRELGLRDPNGYFITFTEPAED